MSAQQPGRPGLAKTFSIVAVLTVLSKFAGLARDIVIAGRYGTSWIADAFNYAYLYTGNVLILFGGLGGPFHSSTVAVVGPQKDEKETGALVMQVLAITFIMLCGVTALAYLGAPYLVQFLADQYRIGNAPAPLEIRENLRSDMLLQLYVMFPLVIIAGLIGVVYGVLNVFNKVAWPSLSPAIASLAIIASIWYFNDPTTGLPIAIGALAGAFGQLMAQVPGFLSTGLSYRLPLKLKPGMRAYLNMLWPAVISTSVGQLTVYVDSFFASLAGVGAWTAIVNANRLVQLPLGVLLTAMLVPILPRFTEHVKVEAMGDLKEELNRALRVLWFMALPLSAILLVLPWQIIAVLFQRGEWTDYSTTITATALVLLVPSIFFYMARDLITRVFYAFQDSKTPYRVALLAIVLKFLLDYLLVVVLAPVVARELAPLIHPHIPAGFQWPAFRTAGAHHIMITEGVRLSYLSLTLAGIAGISIATTIVTIFNLSLLTFFLRSKIGLLGFGTLLSPVLIMLCGATACAIATALVYPLVVADSPNQLIMLAGIAVSSIAGLLVYTLVCLSARLDEPIMVARRLPFIKR